MVFLSNDGQSKQAIGFSERKLFLVGSNECYKFDEDSQASTIDSRELELTVA